MAAAEPLHIGFVAGTDVTLDRLQDQIEWYDAGSGKNQRMFKRLKIATIVAAAMVPLCAALSRLSWAAGGLGVVIVVVEGLQQLNQYHANWIAYRSTCEALKHEKFLYLAKAGPYSTSDAHALLAERLESLVSQEHAKWASGQERTEKKDAPAPPEQPATTHSA
jgi:hypothetical protein